MINYAKRPGLAGKTANLQDVHRCLPQANKLLGETEFPVLFHEGVRRSMWTPP